MKNATVIALLTACLVMLAVIAVKLFVPKPPRTIVEMQKTAIAAMQKAGPDVLASRSIPAESLLTGEQDISFTCEQVMASLVKDDISGAFTIMGRHSSVPESEFATQEQMTVKQLALVRPRFGSMLSYELVKRETAGESAVRYTYVVRCEKHMLRWVFWFYKPKDKWLLDQFRWDDQIDGLFR